MPLDLTNKCYVMDVPLRCENEICKPEITWNEGKTGKKGVSDQNVENISHIEVIMIPQKSECNLDGLVGSGWQSTCVRGRTSDMWTTFSEETLSSRSDVPTSIERWKKVLRRCFIYVAHSTAQWFVVLLFRWRVSQTAG